MERQAVSKGDAIHIRAKHFSKTFSFRKIKEANEKGVTGQISAWQLLLPWMDLQAARASVGRKFAVLTWGHSDSVL